LDVIVLHFEIKKGNVMKNISPRKQLTVTALTAVFVFLAHSAISIAQNAPAEKAIDAPNGQTFSIKMIGPVTQTTDLQIICVLKHDANGDKYIEAMADFNKKLHSLLSGLRDRGEFTGELGETLLFTPPADTIAPKQVLLIGIGDEAGITVDKLQLIGEIAAREAVRLGAEHVSFAPTLRDQGSTRVDVGDGDAAFATGWILAYDTQKRLASQALSSAPIVSTLTIEAGPKFFEGSVSKVTDAVQSATATLQGRSASAYMSN
jgi:Cytosol aminopeptidase family, N-terminal domain